jgi:hypothetical protein
LSERADAGEVEDEAGNQLRDDAVGDPRRAIGPLQEGVPYEPRHDGLEGDEPAERPQFLEDAANDPVDDPARDRDLLAPEVAYVAPELVDLFEGGLAVRQIS